MQVADKLDSYINGPDDAKSAVIVNHDLFGWKAAGCRNVVDRVAAAGHLVIMPDLFRGDSWKYGSDFSPTNLTAFFSVNPDARVQEDIKKVCTFLKKKNITQIGIMGFCWGGRAAFNSSVNGMIKAAVSLHGGGVLVETCKDVACPVFFIQAELDNHPPLALVESMKKALEGMKKEAKLKVYPGVNHGFSVRADPSDANAVKQADTAICDAIDFFKRLQEA